MKAARVHEVGAVPTIDEIDEPAAPHARVTSASLNPVDVAIANGRFYGGTPELPYVIGSEAILVDDDGRRLWYYGRAAIAERIPLPHPDTTVEVPAGVDDEVALACGTAGLTGWLAVSWRTRITPEDTVLVLGASGTLGSTAVQGAKLLGAARVVGAARRIENVPDAADEVVRLEGDYELPAATVIVDGLWGEPAERALAAAAPGVRLVQLGQSAGATATLQSAWIRGKGTRILGHSLAPTPPEVRASAYAELCGHAREGRIRLETETYELDRIDEAWERQSSTSPGVKIVVRVA